MDALILWVKTAPYPAAIAALVIQNLVVFGFAIVFGRVMVVLFASRRVALEPLPLARIEVAAAAGCVLMNTVVTILGLVLWRESVIRFRTGTGIGAWLDVVSLLLIMDFLMYVLHRLAHHPLLFGLMHRLHHDYDRPRPLTLFVLNPFENLSFGLLWLLVVWAHDWSWLGMSVYLFLNVVFGTLGHLGVEPFPDWWKHVPILRHVAGSTFHARHHQDVTGNFGFYTAIWDEVFGTLRKDYWTSFGGMPTDDLSSR
jgi:lathosterol oxidase